MTIQVKPSPTADTRTCDYKRVTRNSCWRVPSSTLPTCGRHLAFFIEQLSVARPCRHDTDKIADIDGLPRGLPDRLQAARRGGTGIGCSTGII